MRKIIILGMFGMSMLYGVEVSKEQLLDNTYYIKLGIYNPKPNIEKLKEIYEDKELYIGRYKNVNDAYIVNIKDKKTAYAMLKDIHKSIKDAYIRDISKLKNSFIKIESKIQNISKTAEPKIKKIAKINLPKKEDITLNKNLFILLGTGYTSFDITSDVNNNILNKGTLDDTGISYDIGVGYNIDSNIFTTLQYQTTKLKNAELKNTYLSLNYIKHCSSYINPYIGAIIGVSHLTWEIEPVLNIIEKSEEDSRLLYGAQIGNGFVVTNYLNLYINYQYIQLDRTAQINSDDSIKHNYQTNLSIGIKYAF